MKMKGISPLLAAVILVALVISIAFIISSAISSMAQKQTTAAAQQGAASANVLVVKGVDCFNDTGYTGASGNFNISFILQNIGPEDVTDISVAYKIGDNTGTASVPLSLASGGVTVVEFTTGVPATSGQTLSYLQVCAKSPAGVCVERTDLSVTCRT